VGSKLRQKKIFFLLIVFTILFFYTINLNTIPEKIILFQNQKLEIGSLRGLNIEGEKVEEKSHLFSKLTSIKSDVLGEIKLNINAFGKVPLKEVTVNVIPNISVIPCGNAIGVKLYSEGVLVVGESKVQGFDKNYYEPYKSTNIEQGDTIVEMNGNKVENINQLIRIVNNCGGKNTNIKFKRNDIIHESYITPIKSIDDNLYKIGLWVRDGAMGIGTLTFYEPNGNYYGALGHGISDIDTKELLNITSGTLNEARILSVNKGQKSVPGELRGSLVSDSIIGTVEENNSFGIYGEYNSFSKIIRNNEAIPVAARNEIKEGKATILCTIEGTMPKEYDVVIQKVLSLSLDSTKSMIIKVVDPELLYKTGGIVQGMSGSPIIQDGKFVGAITHVFVNDPTKGYGVFGDLMLRQVI
jgi:stage IV sporulation protein B